MDKINSPHLALAKSYWKNHLKPGDVAIDATCGNGNDTLYLSQLLLEDPQSAIIGFDIQTVALQNTEALLKKHLSEDQIRRVLLHRKCHGEIGEIPFPSPPRLIVYNLGYLPGSDKKTVTQTNTTLKSVQSALELLPLDGALSITCYPGHEEGEKEEKELLAFVEKLPSHEWFVCYHKWVNRLRSPSLIWILREARKCAH